MFSRKVRPVVGFKGFTLIELLIVIAIILILIAIALPNFLEAQIRARVTKARAELRTYATALESYRTDFGGYPPDQDSAWPYYSPEQDGFRHLTTPIKYLTSLPQDPFGQLVTSGGGAVDRNSAWFYEGGSGSDGSPQCGPSILGIYQQGVRFWSSASCIHAYLLISIGPNADDNTDGNDNFPYGTVLYVYNPTNGTSSAGDIYRTVGEYRRASSTHPAPHVVMTYPGVRYEVGNGLVKPYSGQGE
jgi:type II secretion system protein G